jgi:hypothetical protein
MENNGKNNAQNNRNTATCIARREAADHEKARHEQRRATRAKIRD